MNLVVKDIQIILDGLTLESIENGKINAVGGILGLNI